MNKYTIYCTEEQTKKAFELGAPINATGIYEPPKWCAINGMTYIIPTAEQMIGWLEENGFHHIEISYYIIKDYYVYCCVSNGFHDIVSNGMFSSRKEATLAAIDAALDYLVRSLKEK